MYERRLRTRRKTEALFFHQKEEILIQITFAIKKLRFEIMQKVKNISTFERNCWVELNPSEKKRREGEGGNHR